MRGFILDMKGYILDILSIQILQIIHGFGLLVLMVRHDNHGCCISSGFNRCYNLNLTGAII